jgi:hypothetical protein
MPKKDSHTVKQNRPNWRKKRGFGMKMLKRKDGSPVKINEGRNKGQRKHVQIKRKLKEYEKV